MSLRWVTTRDNISAAAEILRNFYNFHCERGIRNPHYNELRGDHAATIRVNHILNFRDKFLGQGNTEAAKLCDLILFEEIKNLQNPEMYRKGHNHGLMIDITLLKLAKINNSYKSNIDISEISRRGHETLLEMFTENGITREHSISYQEFNYPLAVEFLDLCTGQDSRVNRQYRAVLERETRNILAFALRDCGEYFTLGDTLKQPALSIRQAHPEILMSPVESSQLGNVGNRLYCQDGFFFYKRRAMGESAPFEKDLHFAATCTWHSANHKQDDELSFCLEVGGDLIFDDPGYTVYTPEIDSTLLPASSHSTVFLPHFPFCNTQEPASGSEILQYYETSLGFHLEMVHRRVPLYKIARTFSLVGSLLEIIDSIESERDAELQAEIEHNFILSPGITALIENTSAVLRKNGKIIAIVSTHEQGTWIETRQHTVGSDRFEYIETTKLAFSSPSTEVIFQVQI
ncbi:heparinase II/III family protein [Achromobacter sp. RTa]|uniref:heparinase II/III domain-containing protein n=1 Tax=Achromobacter sp. RTa TaxID=1532557 RepID=UPI0018CEEE08|nr:heparinase II/III family protein [Achromobacter sp. RTa]